MIEFTEVENFEQDFDEDFTGFIVQKWSYDYKNILFIIEKSQSGKYYWSWFDVSTLERMPGRKQVIESFDLGVLVTQKIIERGEPSKAVSNLLIKRLKNGKKTIRN